MPATATMGDFISEVSSNLLERGLLWLKIPGMKDQTRLRGRRRGGRRYLRTRETEVD